MVVRETKETRVSVSLARGRGPLRVETPIPFFNHMLETLIFYAGLHGELRAEDLRGFDDHHVVEDVGITLGRAIAELLGDRRGIKRFGWALVPMDEALAEAAVDVGGRPYSVVRARFRRDSVGGLSLELVPHFVWSLAYNSGATIHVVLRWHSNDHHGVEAMFKALGMALGQAMAVEDDGVTSLKGTYY